MSDQTAEPKEPKGNDKIDPVIEAALENALIRTATLIGGESQGTANAAEIKDYAQACMYIAQALVISNPELVAPDGVPLDALHPPHGLAPVNPNARTAQVVSGRAPKAPAGP